MKFEPMDTFHWRDHVPSLFLHEGNDAHQFVIVQAQAFEGHLYPDMMGYNVDFDDHISTDDLYGWCPLPVVRKPETIIIEKECFCIPCYPAKQEEPK